MSITVKPVQDIFNNLDNGENEKFFECVADNVSWKVMGDTSAGRDIQKQTRFSYTYFCKIK